MRLIEFITRLVIEFSASSRPLPPPLIVLHQAHVTSHLKQGLQPHNLLSHSVII